MRLVPPAPYGVVVLGDAILIASPESMEAARSALMEAGSLLAFAAAHPGAKVMESRRGKAYHVPIGSDSPDQWVVRHYRRGSALTRWLGDRYLRMGTPRPLRELAASIAARHRGVETPPVTAIALYPAGPYYRADLATRHIPGSSNLAQALFESEALPGSERIQALTAAGRLVRTIHERGVVHVDLTLQNILIQWTEAAPTPHLLDLDRCRILPGPVPARLRRQMLRRFARSLRGWEQRSGRLLTSREHAAFREGYNGAGAPAEHALLEFEG